MNWDIIDMQWCHVAMSRKKILFWRLFFINFLFCHFLLASPVNNLGKEAEQKRDEIILEIKALLLAVPADQKAELYFRLAETYKEKANFLYEQEYRQFDVDYEKWIESGRKNAEPQLENYLKQSSLLKNLAFLQYQTVLKEYPDYLRLDEVFYALAHFQSEIGEKQQALRNFLILVERFPKSDFLAEAHLAIGDYYFAKNLVQEAFDAYAHAFRLGMLQQKTSIYVYARYKQAWCDFNDSRFKEALQKFQEVVSLSLDAKYRQETLKTHGKDAVQLQQEALKDMVPVFARLGQVKEAYDYFKTNMEASETILWMQKLARALHELGSYQEAIAANVFLQNLEDSPLKKSPLYEVSILKAYVALEDKKNIREHTAILSEICENEGSVDCDEGEKTLRSLASRYHRFASQSKSTVDYQLARQLYGAYLRGFSQGPHFRRMQFFLAEMLWETKEWELAASLYDEILQKSPHEDFAKAAARNAVLAWGKLAQEDVKKMQANILQPEEISFATQKWIDAVDRYEASVPSAARDKDEKEELINWKSKAQLLVAELKERAAFNGILDAYQKLNSQLDKAMPKENAEVVASRFEHFFADFPQSPHGMKAVYNATMIYAQIPRYDLAMPLAEKWISLFKAKAVRDKESQQMALTLVPLLADMYEKTALLEKAAQANEMYVVLFPKEPLAKEKLYQAALLQVVLEQYGKAAQLYLQYLAQYASLDEKTEIQLSLASAYEKAQKTDLAIAVYQDVVRMFTKSDVKQAVRVQYQLAKMYAQKKDTNSLLSGCKSMQQNINRLKETDPKSEIAQANAFCAYQILESSWRSYQKIQLDVPFSRLSAQIQLKEKKMADLTKRYLQILKYQDPEWSVRVLYRSAEVQLDYVKALREIPKPKILGEEESSLFLSAISEVIFPIEEEAIATLEKALEKAVELRIYTSIVAEIEEKLIGLGARKEKTIFAMPFFVSEIPVEKLVMDLSGHEQEMSEIKKNLILSGGNKNFLKELALLYFQEKKWNLSHWILDRLMETDGEDSAILNMKGLVYLQQNQFSLAKIFLMRAVNLDAKRMDAWLNLGALSLMFGDKRAAFEAYSKAAQIENTSAVALRGREISKQEG